MKKVSRNNLRRKRKNRVRALGNSKIPRLSVYRSNQRVYLQLVDDSKSLTLVGILSEKSSKSDNKKDKAFVAGKKLGEKAIKTLKIKRAVFDRGGYKYHGRVKAALEGAQEAGLKFKK